MYLDGDILAVERSEHKQENLEGKILAVTDKSTKISPLQNFVLYSIAFL